MKDYAPGDVVGSVTLLSYDHTRHMWLCRCKCGTEVYKGVSSLHASARCLACYRKSEAFARHCRGNSVVRRKVWSKT